MAIIHAIAAIPSVFVETPSFDQGEIAVNPNPVPSNSKMSASAAATNAPPSTAPHDIPEEGASGRTDSRVTVCRLAGIDASMLFSLSSSNGSEETASVSSRFQSVGVIPLRCDA